MKDENCHWFVSFVGTEKEATWDCAVITHRAYVEKAFIIL